MIRRSSYEDSCNLEVDKRNATNKHNTELKNEDSYVVCYITIIIIIIIN